MRQLGLAFQTFHDNKQVFPPANHIWRQPNTGYITDQRGWSWAINMLPYIEQQALYDTLDTSSTGGPLIPFPLITYSNGESSPNMHAVATATHLAAFSSPVSPASSLPTSLCKRRRFPTSRSSPRHTTKAIFKQRSTE